MNGKAVLDACCGSRMFWFDKHNKNAVFCDNRTVHTTLCDGRSLDIEPDVLCDFTNLPFENDSFYHVVFDPPPFKHAYGNLVDGEEVRNAQRCGLEAADSRWILGVHEGVKAAWNIDFQVERNRYFCFGNFEGYWHRAIVWTQERKVAENTLDGFYENGGRK